ncbi:MAG TPA: maleylacetoacetate isomerase [Polyangiaceae bacterium]|jgi:maleylpyruvate isomerase
MRLYGYWRSSATWRVRIALAHKNIEYEYVAVNLRKDGGEQNTPAFRAKNPMGRVPVLELELDGETRTLSESMAILELLEERWPEPPLLPKDAFLRARARQLAMLIVSGVQPLQNTGVQIYIEDVLHLDATPWIRHWVTSGLAAVETLVKETAGAFAIGEAPTFVDACIVPQLFFARHFAIDLAACPTLVRIDDACAKLPAFEAAHASNMPDAERPQGT